MIFLLVAQRMFRVAMAIKTAVDAVVSITVIYAALRRRTHVPASDRGAT